MLVRYPIWLRRVDAPGAGTVAALFALESVARALLSTLIAVQAFALLGAAREVSLLFCAVGITGLAASFLIPLIVRRIGRRWTYTLGVGLLVAAPAALATGTLSGLTIGMLVRVFGVACLSIVLSLYILQYIARHELVRSEPLRLQVSALAWTLGPAAGVWLFTTAGPAWPYGLSAAAALALLALFWWLRLAEGGVLVAANRPPPNPVRSIGRFLAQPRLRLAWALVFGRSAWWSFFFVYPPIYMIQQGKGEVAGALVVSAGNAMLFATPVFGRLAARHGVRRVMIAAFIGCGALTLAAAAGFHSPGLVAAAAIAGAVSCVGLDAVGNIPFLRSVRAFERPEMSTVFRTYIDASELIPPAIFAVLLTFFDLRAVFVAMALAMFGFAALARYLPRRM